MEGGDILYIVVLILFLLSGFFKKKKSKEKAQKEVAAKPIFTSSNENKDYDDWFLNDKEEEEKEVVIHKPAFYKETAPFINIPTTQHDEIKSRMKPVAKPNQITTLDVNENKIEIELDTVEEVRKAFIYSEIFQRKY